MLDWIRENHQLIALALSTGTLVVWIFYAHLLLANFKRQRKPSLIINRGAGKGLGSLCLISNMSAEPMFINQLLVCLYTSRGALLADVTEIRDSTEDDAGPDLALYQSTRQGPLRTGDFIHIGTFQGLLRRVAERHNIALDGHQPVGDWEFKAIEIRAVAFYGSDRHPLGVLRAFGLGALDQPECQLTPLSPLTQQLSSRRQRRRVRQWMEQYD